MIAVKLDYDDKIRKVVITGDFFVYPETALREIENAIVGSSANETDAAMREKIVAKVEAAGAELLGITPEAIVSTIKMAMK